MTTQKNDREIPPEICQTNNIITRNILLFYET